MPSPSFGTSHSPLACSGRGATRACVRRPANSSAERKACAHLGACWLQSKSKAERRAAAAIFSGPMRLISIMAALGWNGRLSTDAADQPPFTYAEALQSHRFPTRRTWRANYSRAVCHQFDRRSQAHLAAPPADQLRRFHLRLQEHGLQAVDLGHGRPLAECVDLLAACHAYVGVCSGMSQVASSVGVPLHVVRNEFPLDDFYGIFDRRQGRAYHTLDDVDVRHLEHVGVIRWDDRLNPGA